MTSWKLSQLGQGLRNQGWEPIAGSQARHLARKRTEGVLSVLTPHTPELGSEQAEAPGEKGGSVANVHHLFELLVGVFRKTERLARTTPRLELLGNKGSQGAWSRC